MIPCDLIYILQNTAGGRVLKIHNTRHDQEACRWREAVTKEHARNPFSVFHNYISPWSLETHASPLPNPWQRATHPWSSRCTPLLIVDTIKSSFCSIVPPCYFRRFAAAFKIKRLCLPIITPNWSAWSQIQMCSCKGFLVSEGKDISV